MLKVVIGLCVAGLLFGACVFGGDSTTTAAENGSDAIGSESQDADEQNSVESDDQADSEEGESDGPATTDDDDAVGSSDDDDAVEPSDDGTVDDDAVADGDEPDDAFGAGLVLRDFLVGLVDDAGAELGDGVFDCIADTGADLDLPLLEASEEQLSMAGVALFGCAPEEMAIVMAEDTEPPAGTDRDDVICVATETFRYLGGLTTAEAMTAMSSPSMPIEIQEAVQDAAGDACGLDDDQILAILES